MFYALSNNTGVTPRAMRPMAPIKAQQSQPETPQQIEDRLDKAISEALPQIKDAIQPVKDMTKDIDLTLRANKQTSGQLGEFGGNVRGLGQAVHPFRNHGEMVEAWLGATEFHRFTDSRNPAPMMPALKLKGVLDVCSKDYKIVHTVAPPDWRGQAQAPKYTQVRTDYNKTETVPLDVIYLLEDDKQNHIIVQLNEGQLSVVAHNDQKELVDEFYNKVDKWIDNNNFFKNKILTYNGYLDFQDGLKESKVSWADIALPQASEELIRSNTTGFFENIELYKKNGKFANRNLLMAGPPGTGKSMVNDILMQELHGKVTFIHVTSKSLGGAESVAGIFDAARQMSPAVVVLEDLDMLGATNRNDNARRGTLNEMLNQLSGVYDNTGLVVMGSTNAASQFDEAMLRPLRFSTVVPMPLPNAEIRENILKKITRNIALSDTVDLAALAERTDKFSGAGLTELKELAIQSAIEADSFANGKKVLLRGEDFEKALETIKIKQQYLEQAQEDGGPAAPNE